MYWDCINGFTQKYHNEIITQYTLMRETKQKQPHANRNNNKKIYTHNKKLEWLTKNNNQFRACCSVCRRCELIQTHLILLGGPQRSDFAKYHCRQLASICTGRRAAQTQTMMGFVYGILDAVAFGAQQATNAAAASGANVAARCRVTGR